MMPGVLQFHREFLCYSGGHGKVRDYFEHAQAHPDWLPRVYFSAGRKHAQNPWHDLPHLIDADWRPDAARAAFLGGIDWRHFPEDRSGLPVINLVQGVRHGDPAADVYPFLIRPAIRICVSQPVADAILATGRVRGPVEVIEAGLRLPAMEPVQRKHGVFIDALKQPELGQPLADALRADGFTVQLNLARTPRTDYLRQLAAAEIAVLLPQSAEGLYLPALESMALGCATVVPDCIGNRAYLQPGNNALTPPLNVEALRAAVHELRDEALRHRLIAAAPATVARFDLARERMRFHAVLDRLEDLWREATR